MKKRLIAPQLISDQAWPRLPIIGLAGRARAGKDTVANTLKEHYQCTTYSFATPFKQALSTMLGISLHELEAASKDDQVSQYGCTYRHKMQSLGTEWGRDQIHPDIWVIRAQQLLKELNAQKPDYTIIVTDVRFANEADFIRQHGTLVHIIREDAGIQSCHRSENNLYIKDNDLVIHNGSGLAELRDQALQIAEMIHARSMQELRHAS